MFLVTFTARTPIFNFLDKKLVTEPVRSICGVDPILLHKKRKNEIKKNYRAILTKITDDIANDRTNNISEFQIGQNIFGHKFWHPKKSVKFSKLTCYFAFWYIHFPISRYRQTCSRNARFTIIGDFYEVKKLKYLKSEKMGFIKF